MRPQWRHILHQLLFALGALTTLVIVFYAEENWRGARAWAGVKRELKARGESLNFGELVPPPVPDDQNLAMAPLFTRLFQYKFDPRTRALTFNRSAEFSKGDTYKLCDGMPFGTDKSNLSRPVFSDWRSGHSLDLSVAQRWYQQHPEFPRAAQPQTPVDDVLLALTRYAPLLDELARASAERPLTRFPVSWTLRPAYGINLPHYNTLQLLTATLRLRAVAELRAGQILAARRDIAQMVRLRGSIVNEPTVIASLVDITCVRILVQAVWEGLAARQWSADDLDALRDSLLGINVLREYRAGIRGERASIAARWPEDLQDMAQARSIARGWSSMTSEEVGFSPSSVERWLWQGLPYWPRGWYEQNAAFACLYFQDTWIDSVDPASHRMASAKDKEAKHKLRNMPLAPGRLLAKSALPIFSNMAEKFAQIQSTVDQAVIACALEKYYLDHRSYPALLTALVPGHLERVPNDVIDGAPMRYRLTADGRYQLYSIGWNGKDDGGTIDWPPDRKWRRASCGSPAGQEQPFPSPSKDQGDWVWQYAPAEPPDPPQNQSRLESLP